ncbi:MAG TPA: hypothetical protein VE971_03450 [Candidatus Eisenbacteria bacterium]|nr:hypothetical protein [Candidatus Eisenbacteria bacterium]
MHQLHLLRPTKQTPSGGVVGAAGVLVGAMAAGTAPSPTTEGGTIIIGGSQCKLNQSSLLIF